MAKKEQQSRVKFVSKRFARQEGARRVQETTTPAERRAEEASNRRKQKKGK
jgi:hypothetical protein